MKLRPNPDLAVRKIDNELFVYNRDKALVHSFNRTGVFLWEVIDAGAAYDDILARLTATFDVDQQTARADLDGFIARLRDLGLIV
jgi:PqqD family protein of HPr-rel-A system